MKSRRLVLLGNLALGGVLMLAVWALLVWVGSRPALKVLFDLTPQRVNSVDPVTEELLRDLRAQKAAVEFHLFVPPYPGQGVDDASRQALAIRQRLVHLTRSLLKTYQYLGAESVTVHDYDFVVDAEAATAAASAFGYKVAEGETIVVAVAMAGKERRFRKLSVITDLAVIDRPNTGGASPVRASVPVLRDYVGEEGISSALKSLLLQGIPVAYLLQGYSPQVDFASTAPSGYRSLVEALDRSGFDVRSFNFRDQPMVPADAALVVVLSPNSEFTDHHANALFDYVKRGGRVFVNYAWNALPDWNPTGGRFGELLGYEVSVAPVFHLIPGTRHTAGRGTDGDPTVARLQLPRFANHPTTRRIAESGRPVEIGYAREVRARPDAPPAITRTELLATGDDGWRGEMGPEGMPNWRAPQGIKLRPFVVGMALEVPPAGEGDDARPGQVVVVAGEFCSNALMQSGSGELALNICNWMAERRVLLDIRGTDYVTRNLVLQQAQIERIRSLLVFGVPGAFLVCGLIVFFVRRRQ